MTDGDTIDAGDRTLVAKRPPLYDNPTTRALFDPKTNVLWSVDTFATNVPAPMPEMGALSPTTNSATASSSAEAWSPLGRPAGRPEVRDGRHRLPTPDAEVIAGCHCPVLRGPTDPRGLRLPPPAPRNPTVGRVHPGRPGPVDGGCRELGSAGAAAAVGDVSGAAARLGRAENWGPCLASCRDDRGVGRGPRIRPLRVRGDSAYPSRANRAYLRRRGIRCTIPEPADQAGHRRRRGAVGERPPATRSSAATPPAANTTSPRCGQLRPGRRP